MERCNVVKFEQIENAVFCEFRNRQFRSLQKKRVGILHVTDMVQQCTRNIFYSKMSVHNQAHNYDTESLSHFFGGEAVHQLLDKIAAPFQGEYPLYYNFVDDKKVEIFRDYENFELTDEAKSWDTKDWLKILVGERDAIYRVSIEDEEHHILVDYKTFLSKGYKKREPSSEHVEQLNIYKYLMSKSAGEEIKHGAVIYMDYADKFGKPLIFIKKLDKVEDIHTRLMEKYVDILHAHETGQLPERTRHWKCDKYCPYASRCFTEEFVSEEDAKLQAVV